MGHKKAEAPSLPTAKLVAVGGLQQLTAPFDLQVTLNTL